MENKPEYGQYTNHNRYKSDLIIWQEKQIKELEAIIDHIRRMILVGSYDVSLQRRQTRTNKNDKWSALMLMRGRERKRTMAMNENVVNLPETRRLDIPADRMLEAAIGELDEVVIVGTHKDGTEYFASSVADGPNVNWMLDRAKKALVEIVDNR